MSALSEDVLASLEKFALLNAFRHGGKAEVGAVVSKILGETPSLRTRGKEVARAAADAVARVNARPAAEQERLLRERHPELLEEQRKEGRTGLPPLANAEKGKVVLRLPPEPSGFMHIGHAMAGTINAVYRDMYEGELWLRFEDTNPKKVLKRYYESFREGYRWLGISWDKEKCVSSDIETLYEYAQRLIEGGHAFACSCKAETVKKLRFDGTACEHRDQPVEKNLSVWSEMLARKHKEGEFVVRLKGDLSSLDYSLRDPNILRVIDHPHPLTGERYVVWPTYDFEVVIEDHLCGVTHVLRSSEFHLGLQDAIRVLLELPPVSVTQFSRFNFKGTPVQKRLLRPLVEQKLVSGWDDPRMPTIEGVRRRGILSEAIRQFTVQVGYTKSEHTFDWSLLFAVNRKLLDPVTRRLFFVPDPVELEVEGAPRKVAEIRFHPTADLGARRIETEGRFYVARGDAEAALKGAVFRLMDLYNVKLSSLSGDRARATFAGDELLQETKKVQWVPVKDALPVMVLEPSQLYNDDGSFNADSLRTKRGFAEGGFASLKPGDIVQFPRYGFVRVDGPERCILAHP